MNMINEKNMETVVTFNGAPIENISIQVDYTTSIEKCIEELNELEWRCRSHVKELDRTRWNLENTNPEYYNEYIKPDFDRQRALEEHLMKYNYCPRCYKRIEGLKGQCEPCVDDMYEEYESRLLFNYLNG